MAGIHYNVPGGGGGGPVNAVDVAVTNAPYDNQQQVNDALLYVPLLITGFGHAHGTQMKGSTLANVTLTWGYNKAVTSQLLNSVSKAVGLRTNTFAGANLTANTTYTLAATDGTTPRMTTATIAFANQRFAGVGAPGLTTPAGLGGVELVESRARTVTVTAGAGQKAYISFPLRLGANPGNPAAQQATYSVGGFAGGFTETVVSYTNPAGFAESYVIAETVNTGLGTITITVS